MSYHSPTAVFVIITAKDCGACQKFKLTESDDLFNDLRKLSSVKVEEITIPSTHNSRLPKGYHPGLQKVCGWYPFFALIPYSSWMDHKNPLKISIVGLGTDKTGQRRYVGGVDITADGLYGWIKNKLQQPMFTQTALPVAPRPGMVYTVPVVKQFMSYRPEDERPVDY